MVEVWWHGGGFKHPPSAHHERKSLSIVVEKKMMELLKAVSECFSIAFKFCCWGQSLKRKRQHQILTSFLFKTNFH